MHSLLLFCDWLIPLFDLSQGNENGTFFHNMLIDISAEIYLFICDFNNSDSGLSAFRLDFLWRPVSAGSFALALGGLARDWNGLASGFNI